MQLVELFLTWQILLKQNSENCMRFLWFCVQISKSEIRTLDSRPYSAWYVFSMHYLNYLTSCLNTGHTAYRILNGYKQSKTEIYFSSFPRTLQHLSWICIPLRWWCTVVWFFFFEQLNTTDIANCLPIQTQLSVIMWNILKMQP